jgi:hypothetical protein
MVTKSNYLSNEHKTGRNIGSINNGIAEGLR